jgi:ATP-dependent 26S proteasome regulatory subunit
VRLGLRTLDKEYDKSEDDIKALQSVGQVIGEVLKQLDDERCKFKKKMIHQYQKYLSFLL